MKKRRFSYADGKESPNMLLIRCMICAIALAAAVLLKNTGPPDFYDSLLYAMNSGPDINEVVEAFGRLPVSSEALARLWSSAVEEPVSGLFP